MLAVATTLWLPVSAGGSQHQVAMSPELVHERFVKCGYDVTPPMLLGQLPLGTAVQVAPFGGGKRRWDGSIGSAGRSRAGSPARGMWQAPSDRPG